MKHVAGAVEVEVHSVIGLQGMPQLGAALVRAIPVEKMERGSAKCMLWRRIGCLDDEKLLKVQA